MATVTSGGSFACHQYRTRPAVPAGGARIGRCNADGGARSPWTFALSSSRTASLRSGALACSASSSSPSTCPITAFGPRCSPWPTPAFPSATNRSCATCRAASRSLAPAPSSPGTARSGPRGAPRRAARARLVAAVAPARGVCARSAGIARQALFPDPQVLWQPAAHGRPRTRLAARRDDAVLVSGPPFSQFLLAPLARAGRVGVVLDYRDEWSTLRSTYEMARSRVARCARRSARGGAPPSSARRRDGDRRVSREPPLALSVPRSRPRLRHPQRVRSGRLPDPLPSPPPAIASS